jgi:hypothetical protein
VETVRASLLPGGDGEAERIARFAERCRELRAEFVLVDGVAALPAALRALSHREGFVRIATHRSELTDAACRDLSASILSTDGGYDKHELERADAGVTACDALVAQTGSVLVSSRSTGGRAISVLPPHHVVLARREQLVPVRGVFAGEGALRRRLSEHALVHHGAEPHRRHRARVGARRTRAEASDDLVRVTKVAVQFARPPAHAMAPARCSRNAGSA